MNFVRTFKELLALQAQSKIYRIQDEFCETFTIIRPSEILVSAIIVANDMEKLFYLYAEDFEQATWILKTKNK